MLWNKNIILLLSNLDYYTLAISYEKYIVKYFSASYYRVVFMTTQRR